MGLLGPRESRHTPCGTGCCSKDIDRDLGNIGCYNRCRFPDYSFLELVHAGQRSRNQGCLSVKVTYLPKFREG